MRSRGPGGVGAGSPALATALATALLLAGCTGSPQRTGPAPAGPSQPGPSQPRPSDQRVEPDLELAVSEPVEDSVYPGAGDPGVDALHYDLDLAWAPGPRRLQGTATITLRATGDAPSLQLDLAGSLRVTALTLDGRPASYRHRGKDLQVTGPVRADRRYRLVVDYAGRPRPEPAPTTRPDFTTLGFTVTPQGEVWTMQEPYGAYSWYPVNDQPADKALYDFTITAPSPWTGIANGRRVSTQHAEGRTTTSYRLDEPASSYLVTLAIGDYAHAEDASGSGVPIDYWYPGRRPGVLADLRVAAEAVDWIEARLGPYPFSSLGLVVTDSTSAMETQTMITLGDTAYVRSAPVIVHELVHQWYGDQVSPSDWRDVWLSEGMTMLLQGLWQAESTGVPFERTTAQWAAHDQELRDRFGPPGDYDPAQFGGGNIYYPPALMWDQLRRRLGEEEFFAIARAWLAEHDNGSASREELYAFWEEQTGLELSAFFDAWIMGRTTPDPAG